MTNHYKFISRVLPFAAYILFLALNDFLTPLFHQFNIDEKALYVIRVSVVAMLLVYFWQEFYELKVKPKITDLLVALFAGIAVLLIWILPFPSWATLGGDHIGFDPIAGETKLAACFWLSSRILGAALIVPVMEELFWRSFVMRWADNKNFLYVKPENITIFALFSSSALFALEHNLWLAGLLAGLVYGALYIKYKNLWIPIFSHAVTNGLLGIWVVQTGKWQYW